MNFGGSEISIEFIWYLNSFGFEFRFPLLIAFAAGIYIWVIFRALHAAHRKFTNLEIDSKGERHWGKACDDSESEVAAVTYVAPKCGKLLRNISRRNFV